MNNITINGLNIQAPWSGLLISGSKTIETRSYPLPLKYQNKELALIETPGKKGLFKSRIIGKITFSYSFKYNSKIEWLNDYHKHLVPDNDENYAWKYYKSKYGWVVNNVTRFNEPVDPPKRRGIIFAKGCCV